MRVVTRPKPEMRSLDPLMLTLLCLILFFFVIPPTTNLIAGQRIFNNEDVKTELSVFQNNSTNVEHEWVQWWVQDFCSSVADGGQSEKSIFQLQYGNETKGDLAHSPFRDFSESDRGDWPQNLKPRCTLGWVQDFHLRGSDDSQLKMSIQAPLLHPVSGEFSSHENHKGNEQRYGRKLIFESQSKLNNSESYQEHTRTDAEHRSTTAHVKNGENDVKLRFLVPSKNTFPEFVKVDHDTKGNGITATGYAIEVFKEVMGSLAEKVSYEFFTYENGCYDELIQQLHVNGYDGVVGDITITSNRSMYGDFTQPYMMAGVSMIVPVGGRKSLWWFLKPFTVGSWSLMLALFLFNMLMLWYIEHRVNNPALHCSFSGQAWETLLLGFPIFGTGQTRELKSKWSRLILFMLIVEPVVPIVFYQTALPQMASYNNGGPIVTGVEKLIMNEDYVGYQKGSFVLGLLIDMGFQEQNLKAYCSIEEYESALSKGSRNNGVSAIIDEIPYIQPILARHHGRYTMAGPTFRPNSGFGFFFKRGSTITRDVSDGVLKFQEGEMMSRLEKKWFGSYEPNSSSAQTPQQLSVPDFYGIIVITIPIKLLAFIIFIVFKCRETTLNRPQVQMTGVTVNGDPHTGTVGSDQTRSTDNSPEVDDTRIDLGNTGIASGENVEPMADSPAHPLAVDIVRLPLSPEIQEG